MCIKFLYGLDLSMSNTGIAIFDINTCKPALITSVKTNSKNTHGKRLHGQREYMKELIKKYPPHEVAIERGFSHMNTTTQVIYRVHGIANELFYEYPQFYYPPATVKKIVGKHGQAKKEVVQANILKKYPDLKFANNDESDATAVALTHLIKKHKMKWN
jgi:Holliday junction resolvasome RuvABC endonuclease subunit